MNYPSTRSPQRQRFPSNWLPPVSHPLLPGAAIHVWSIRLEEWTTHIPQFLQVLSNEELIKAARYHSSVDRTRFVTCRAVLRLLLSMYLHVPATQLRFCYGEFGKPALCLSSHCSRLQFNISHAHEYALFAISENRSLGIDLEPLRSIAESRAIAMEFFSPQENQALSSLQEQEWDRAFLNCWTRKESFVKALGGGLSLSLNNFTITVQSGGPVRLLDFTGELSQPAHWSFRELQPVSGYIGALAAEGRDWELSCWHLQDELLLS